MPERNRLAVCLGRHVYGTAAILFGIVTLAWHRALDVVAIAGIAQLLGGLVIQFRSTRKVGAALLSVVYVGLALQCIPRIIATPRVYDAWGNFFEPFSLATGAALVFGSASAWPGDGLVRVGRVLLGICAVSFTLEQALYLNQTATLVPSWLPPSPMFWAIATTIAFAAGAAALLIGMQTRRAAELLTLMIVLFGIIVWLPAIAHDPHSHANWSETADNFAIAGAMWILTDLLRRPSSRYA